MSKKIHFIKADGALYPAFEKDHESFKGLKDSKVIKGVFSHPRNPDFLSKYWCLCQFVIDNLPEGFEFETPTGKRIPIKTTEDVSFHIKLQIGLWTLKMTLGGEAVYQVGSIAFHKMKEEDFERFFSNALDKVLKYFIQPPPSVNQEEYKRRITEEIFNKFILRNK